MSKVNVGIDIGGTFTDFVFINDEGNRFHGKTLTTYPDPSMGFLNGLYENLEKHGMRVADITSITHGTTLVVNALIERKGVKTALITTEGFRDQIEIGTESRFDLYDLFLEKAEPLVPRYLRYTIQERILSDGEVYQPLNEEQIRIIFKEIAKQKVEAVAVCLLHSYINPQHEKRIKEIGNEIAPNIRVSISSDVCPEIREYQRSTTTIANVYIQPIVENYLLKLESELLKKGFTGSFHMMLSGGGTCTIKTACNLPIRILESGPVGGAMAGAYYSKLINKSNLLVFDMGGTTAKASLVDHGVPLVTNEFEVARAHRFKKGSGIPVKVPVIEMIEIGAGGGSIAHIGSLGLLKVGPQSANSEPGPACYGRGGINPTVTDADLILGYINPEFFLGGDMKLDVEAAKNVIQEKVAKPLQLSLVEAAWGIHQVVNENMASAARIHAVEKGKDIRNYPLYAIGGAGPVHVCNVASILGVSKVISPFGAGVCSSFGFLTSPISFDFVRSYHEQLDRLDWDKLMMLLDEMEKEGIDLLKRSNIDESEIIIERSCEMRYVGQSYEIRTDIPKGNLTKDSFEIIKNNFEKQYNNLYSGANHDIPIETLNWRVVVKGPDPRVNMNINVGKGNLLPVPKAKRKVFFSELRGYTNTPVYDRSKLTPGMTVPGPAIIEERESTLVVNSEFIITVDTYLNVILSKKNLTGGFSNEGVDEKQYV